LPHTGAAAPLTMEELCAELLFAEIDVDGSGTLDRDEIATMAKQLGSPLSESALDEAMAEMDLDGSGEVDFEEFYAWFQRLQAGGQGAQGHGATGWALVAQLRAEYFFQSIKGDGSERALGKQLDRLEARMTHADELEQKRRAACASRRVGGGVGGGAAAAAAGRQAVRLAMHELPAQHSAGEGSTRRSSPVRFGRRAVAVEPAAAAGTAWRWRQTRPSSPQWARRQRELPRGSRSIGCVSSDANDRRVLWVSRQSTAAGPRAQMAVVRPDHAPPS
jgi:hypothetical protein